MNAPRDYQPGTLRFSLGRTTTEPEVDTLIQTLTSIL